jgi:hypothetical protein
VKKEREEDREKKKKEDLFMESIRKYKRTCNGDK